MESMETEGMIWKGFKVRRERYTDVVATVRQRSVIERVARRRARVLVI